MKAVDQSHDPRRRLLVAGIGIPLGVTVTYLGVWSAAAILSAFAALGTRELYRLAERSGARPFRLLGIPASALLVLSAAWSDGLHGWALLALSIVLGLCLVGLGASVFFRTVDDRPLASISTTVMGPLYLGITLGFGVRLRAFAGAAYAGPGWEGALLLILPMFIAWMGDSAAYFVGHRWGRARLMPRVSPGKTVAGSVGGLFGSVVSSVLFIGLLVGPVVGLELSLAAAALIGIVVGGIAQIGDLAESILKREAGVKDSGALFPGHGGVLDRFDSVLYAFPVTYLLLWGLTGR